MADFADAAQEITERDLAVILAGRNQATEEPDEDAMGRYCLTCGVTIPALRVAAVNAVRCVDCQSVHEAHNRLRAG